MPGFHTITRLKNGKTGIACPGAICGEARAIEQAQLGTLVGEQRQRRRDQAPFARRSGFMPGHAGAADRVGAAVAEIG